MTTIPHSRLFTEIRPDGTERWLDVRAAYDFRAKPPAPNYGIHGTDWIFGLKRGRVAVVLRWMVPFYLKHVRAELEGKPYVGGLFDGLGGIDYHSPIALYEGQSGREECEYTGGVCYCDGTALGAGALFEKFVSDPGELWRELESWLADTERKVAEQESLARNCG